MWTKPLRELTRETTMGFEVIDFALMILGVHLYPWQQWFLIHALEILEDGSYRFRRIIGLVARQNGKTKLITVLAAWWLFIDSKRFPDRIHPRDFKVLGTAQNLDIARDSWNAVGRFCDPKDDDSVPALRGETNKISGSHGFEALICKNKTVYEIRAANKQAGRGKSAARVIMDELREQRNWDAWAAISQTTKAVFNSQLIGISNAGDAGSIVLAAQRDLAMAFIAAWEAYVEAGIQSIEDFANEHDTSLGIFEWSAPPDCDPDDLDGILQANPSIGYGEITLQSIRADREGMPDREYRTEVLCQWVTAQFDSFIDVRSWKNLHLPIEDIHITKGSRTVWAVDTSADRSMTWVAAAVFTEDGRPFATVRTKRAGMMWLPAYMKNLAAESGHSEVVLQGRGCPAVEFIEPLKEAGLTVHALEGGQFALATGRTRDRVRDSELVTIEQPDVDLAVEGGVVMAYAENLAWSRNRSLPIDIAGLVAESEALYGLEVLEPAPTAPTPPPPPQAEIVTRHDVAPNEVNLATAQF